MSLPKKSFWKSRPDTSFSFICPICHTHRKIPYRPQPGGLRHYSQIGLTSLTFTLFAWNWLGWKGIVSFVPLWSVFEFLYRWRIRGLLPCQHCGFDPYLFKIDVQKAKQEVEAHWRKKFAEKGIPYPEPKPHERPKTRLPKPNPEQSLRVPLLAMTALTLATIGLLPPLLRTSSAMEREKQATTPQSQSRPPFKKSALLTLREEIIRPDWAQHFLGDPTKDPKGRYQIAGAWTEDDLNETETYYQKDPLFQKGYLVDNNGVRQYIRRSARDPGRLFFKIVDSNTHKAIGAVSFRELGPKPKIGSEPVLSYFLNKEYWGKNVTASAIAAALPFVFEDPQVRAVLADTNYDNEASKSVLKKLNFKQVPMPEGAEPGDYFELTREAFLQSQLGLAPATQPSQADPRVSEREKRPNGGESISGAQEHSSQPGHANNAK